MNSSFQKLLYDQMIDTLMGEPEANADAMRQAVLNGALLSEYLVKEALRAKNPLAPYDLDRLNNAHGTLKKILESGPEDAPEARHADISVLLGRAEALEVLAQQHIELIARVKGVRNGIMHNAHQDIDDLRCQLELIQTFSDHAQAYKDTLGLELDPEKAKRFAQLNAQIVTMIEERLENRIAEAKATWAALSKAEQDARKATPVLDGDEFEIVGPMACPACGNKSFHYIGYVDFDWNPDGVITLSSAWLTCRLCEVKIDEDDLAEIVEDPKKYTKRDQPDPSWQEFFDYRHMAENAYDYM